MDLQVQVKHLSLGKLQVHSIAKSQRYVMDQRYLISTLVGPSRRSEISLLMLKLSKLKKEINLDFTLSSSMKLMPFVELEGHEVIAPELVTML